MAPSAPRPPGAPRAGSAYLSTPGRPLFPRLLLRGLCGEARGSAATLCALGSPFPPPVREGHLSRRRNQRQKAPGKPGALFSHSSSSSAHQKGVLLIVLSTSALSALFPPSRPPLEAGAGPRGASPLWPGYRGCGALVATHPPVRPGAASEASRIPWGVPSPVDPFGLRLLLRSLTPR